MIRWKSALLGAVVFVTAHLVLMARWREWFLPGGDFPPWFLNSGRAVAFTAASLAVAAAVAVSVERAPRHDVIEGANVAAGAFAAMAVVLAVTGPGTIFPIALAVGASVAAASSAVGVALNVLVRRFGRVDRP